MLLLYSPTYIKFNLFLQVICILCVIMQNQRKRKLQSRGSSCPESNILAIECGGMRHANKRPGPNSPELITGTQIHSRNFNIETYHNRIVDSLSPPPPHLPNNAEDSCYSHFTQASNSLSYGPSNQVSNLGHFNFSPPRSPAPVSHNSSVFTFDVPSTLQPELRQVVTPVTPANLLDEEARMPHHLKSYSSESYIPNQCSDPVGRALHSQRFYQRSQSAVARLVTLQATRNFLLMLWLEIYSLSVYTLANTNLLIS